MKMQVWPKMELEPAGNAESPWDGLNEYMESFQGVSIRKILFSRVKRRRKARQALLITSFERLPSELVLAWAGRVFTRRPPCSDGRFISLHAPDAYVWAKCLL